MLSLRIIDSPWILERSSRHFFEGVRIGVNRANVAKRFFDERSNTPKAKSPFLKSLFDLRIAKGFWPTVLFAQTRYGETWHVQSEYRASKCLQDRGSFSQFGFSRLLHPPGKSQTGFGFRAVAVGKGGDLC